jgi:hypothetical protein
MSDNGAVPQNIYLRIKVWLEERKTGQITLNMSDGRIVNAELKEKVQAQ